MDSTNRGIFNTTILALLTETAKVRISSSTGTFDVNTIDATIISRILSNTTLHQGVANNVINSSWLGTNAQFMTAATTCTTSLATSLHENIAHGCGNNGVTHWIPNAGLQRETSTSGEIANGEYLKIWVKVQTTPTAEPGGYGTNLKLWLKADDGTNTTVSGEDVSSWLDQSVHTNNGITDGFSPEYSTDEADLINYNPVINFRESNTDYLNIASNLNISKKPIQEYSFFGVSRYVDNKLFFLGGQKTPSLPPEGLFTLGINNINGGDLRAWRWNAISGCHPLDGVDGLYPTTTDQIAISKIVRSGQNTSDYVNNKLGNSTFCSSTFPNVNLRIGAGGAGTDGNQYSSQNMG